MIIVRCGIRAYFRLNTIVVENTEENNKLKQLKDVFLYRPNGTYEIGFRFSFPPLEYNTTSIFEKIYYINKKVFVAFKSNIKNKSCVELIEVDDSQIRFRYDEIPKEIPFTVKTP